MNKIYYTWQHVHQLTDVIAQKIHNDGWKPDIVVGITRGGLVPAVILSHEFGNILETINISLRDNLNQTDQHLQKIINYAITGYKVLIVDDINDTGATIECIRDQLGAQSNIRIAVLTNNVSSNSQVDYWGTQINKHQDPSWIVYPWEQGGQSCHITC